MRALSADFIFLSQNGIIVMIHLLAIIVAMRTARLNEKGQALHLLHELLELRVNLLYQDRVL